MRTAVYIIVCLVILSVVSVGGTVAQVLVVRHYDFDSDQVKAGVNVGYWIGTLTTFTVLFTFRVYELTEEKR